MKKSLLALAVLGAFAGTASAQSTVTMYGNVTLGVVKSSGVSPRLDSGNGNNTLGVKGSEDLGGGLKATFDLQERFSMESGGNDGSNNARPAFQGKTIVGLAGGFGAVNIGRQLSPVNQMSGNGEPINPAGTVVTANLDILPLTYQTDPRTSGGATGGDGGGSARTDYFQYVSPNFGGFVANVGYGLKNSAADGNTSTTTNPAGVANEAGSKAFTALTLTYAGGPVYAGFGYEKNRFEDKWTLLNGTYDFGVVKLYAGTSSVDVKATAGSKAKASVLGVRVPFGAFSAGVGFGKAKAEGTGAKTDYASLGGRYDLSKRTWLFTTYGQVKAKATGVKTKKADFGIFHAF